MPNKGVIFQKWDRENKKYKATLPNGDAVYFGDTRYQQYEDRSPLKFFKKIDHRDPKRRELYYKRHPTDYDKYSPDYFAKIFVVIYYMFQWFTRCI